MQVTSITNQNNTAPNFKQLYVSNEALKFLKTDKATLEKIPVIKKYSKDYDLYIKSNQMKDLKAYNLAKAANTAVTGTLAAMTAITTTSCLGQNIVGIALAIPILIVTAYKYLKYKNAKDVFNCNLSVSEKLPQSVHDYYGDNTNIKDYQVNYRKEGGFINSNIIDFYSIQDLKEMDLESCFDDFKLGTGEISIFEDYKKFFYKTYGLRIDWYLQQRLPQNITKYQKYVLINEIMQDKNLSKYFVESLLANKDRDKYSDEYKEKESVKNALGPDLFNVWITQETKGGYRKAYNDYFNEEIYDKCTNLMDLVKISPNIAPWALRAKARELGIEVTLGNLPKDLGDKNNYRKLIHKLQLLNIDMHSKAEKKYPQAEDGSYNIKIGKKNYKIEPNNQGASAKLVFRVTPEQSNEHYFVKFTPYKVTGEDYKNKKIRENYDLRGDSPYMNAVVDFYLKENDCKNANDIKFYDAISQSVVYKETVGEKAHFQKSDLYSLRKDENIADIAALGVQLNDISEDNFIKTKDGRYVLIDSGHATFHDDFKPLVIGKQISLSNLCGRE